MAAPNTFKSNLGLSIIGVGRQYPPYSLKPDSLNTLSKRFYPESPAMTKVLGINQLTGIEARSSIGTPDHPLVNQEKAPTIKQLSDIFFQEGVPLAVQAAQKAIAEARIDLSQITHVVANTCTNSANPGFDHFVVKGLGIKQQVEKVLLHGIGCSGGLAGLRTAANLALGHTMQGKPARILVVTLELSTMMVRSELDSIHELQETRIGVALFSDCGSAVVLSNGIGESAEPIYELLGWDHRMIPDTEEDLGFDVDPVGWKVVLSPRVPKLAAEVLQPTFRDLVASVPDLPPTYQAAADFDWAMHPGGSTILSGAERAMGISPEHMRASYDTYINHGNSSSATIFSVLDRLREKDMDAWAPGGKGPKEYIIGCAFGPGIAVESCILKRNMRVTGIDTPPETESEASRSEAGDAGEEKTTASSTQAGPQTITSQVNNLELGSN
ncbi:type III polyketide synthase [Sporothrix schenckii 1099-18]|uniref:Type III polyketide synthase n=1 Tax=Sporothrix schenckii 1099-18 TaxID=1397361 RepID=A0A0F2M0G9_SPOSC|nr:type III polyketide synthase [Sporothrix schenckii 1099-18]KJR83197.1 type III polyketide synthase [Sporothrix schenckii 1099-18]